MKASAGKDNSTPLQSSRPVFAQKGEGSFFTQTNEAEQPFFAPGIFRQVSSDYHTPHKPFFQAKSQPVIQAKLTINEPGDQYEQEADAMADRVMRMTSVPPAGDGALSQTGLSTVPSLQRKCATCEEEDKIQREEMEEEEPLQRKEISTGGFGGSEPIIIQRKCATCEEEEKVQRQEMEEEEPVQTKPLMRKADGGGYTATPRLQSQLNSSKGGGSPLPGSTLASMNQAFGADFSHVRIHTDSQSAEMSQGIQAKAFTHGSDIYFNRGQYSPESSEGKRLLGHELTHVVQQGAARHKIPSHIQRAMKFEFQTKNVVWRTSNKKKEKLPRKFGPINKPKHSRFLHKGTQGKPAVEKGTWIEVNKKHRKPSQYLWTFQVIISPKGKVDFFGEKAIVKLLKSKVRNPDAKGVEFEPNTYESRYYDVKNKQLYVRLNKSRDKFERLSLLRHPYQMTQVPKSKEGTAIELQSEARGFIEFEMASWHSEWCTVKKRIQEAVNMVDKINKSKVVSNIGGVKTVEFPFDIQHLKKTNDFKQGLTADESLEVEILDPTWTAKIQASESFELSQFESYLKEHLPIQFASITGSAKNILATANTKKIPDKNLAHLLNFLQIIIEHITEAQRHNTGNTHLAKEYINLMSRTNFSSIYRKLLTDVEQKLFKKIVKSNAIPNELGLKPGSRVFPAGFVGRKSPGPKIREWLVSIYNQKRDLLSSLGGDNRAMGRFEVDTNKGKEGTDLVKFEARGTAGHKQSRPVVDKKNAKGVVVLGGWVAFAKEVFKAAHTNRPRTGSTELIYNPNKCP